MEINRMVTTKENDSGAAPLDLALAAVEAIEAAGLVALPVDPTPAMIAAGVDTGRLSPEKTVSVYRAMIAAAP